MSEPRSVKARDAPGREHDPDPEPAEIGAWALLHPAHSVERDDPGDERDAEKDCGNADRAYLQR